jgi:hypothetical protein
MTDEPNGTDGGGGTAPFPVVEVGMIGEITRAEVDVQVATAKKYPRSISRFRKDLHEAVTVDQETAGTMFYTLERGKGRNKKIIPGPSVRFAECVQWAWGNIRSEGRVVGTTDTEVIAQGVCWDLERNVGSRIEVRRRITDRNGNRYNADMITVTGNAAVSIALRNAIFDVVPFSLAKKAYDQARRTAVGEGKTFEARRLEILADLLELGVEAETVFAHMGIDGVADLTTNHVRHLIGLRNAIREGETTAGAIFDPPKAESAGARGLNEELGDEPDPEPEGKGNPDPPIDPPDEPAAEEFELSRLVARGLAARTAGLLDSDDETAINEALDSKDGPAVRMWIEEIKSRMGKAEPNATDEGRNPANDSGNRG